MEGDKLVVLCHVVGCYLYDDFGDKIRTWAWRLF